MNKLTICAVLVCAAMGTSHARAGGSEACRKVLESMKPIYYVKAGNCSRSIKQIGSFTDVTQACWKASEAKASNTLVEITTGDSGGDTLGGPAQEYRVYYRACKSYQLTATTWNEKVVHAVVKELEKDGGDVRIVKVYNEKK